MITDYLACDQLAQTFLGAVILAAVFFYWLGHRGFKENAKDAQLWREHVQTLSANAHDEK